jgi:hypothetical protein
MLVDPEVGLCAKDSRFGEAQVIQRVAAFGAGQLTSEQIQRIAKHFLGTDLVVHLIDRDPSGRTPPRWSTVAHRKLEDRVLANLTRLRKRIGVATPAVVDETLLQHRHLGEDQSRAVRILAGSGPAVRALIAPPGHGKTTVLRAGADAAVQSGRPVVALATTNQAVGELRHVGLEASTVARFALDGCHLQPDSVIIVDELSQLPTAEADLILSAVEGCMGAQLWLVGDPLQTQPVRAGGLAPLIAKLAEQGRIPSATLTVNRRQVDPVEREALSRFRDGEVSSSQQLRQEAGLEHQAGSPEAARAGMADSVADAIGRYGGRQVAALAVTHADCEDVADLIRRGLVQRGIISGPAMRGRGWAGPRWYQAGDRILLHAHLDLPHGRRLTNGSVATVTNVSDSGLTVRPDSSTEPVLLPHAFVSARRTDGRPQLSHAWCRTIDGVQGGTWTEVHLLGTAALDRYRGYVGQSRATAATHTWNTRAVDPGDHGGRLVQEAATPAEEVLVALQRAERKTFAAFDDPYRLAERLERERAAHRVVLAGRPMEDPSRVAQARAAATAAERDLTQSQERVAYWQAECDATHRQPTATHPGMWPTAGYPVHENIHGQALGVDR